MFKFDNTHIFTGYLKQLLSSFNLPTCRIYTKEYADYSAANDGREDPRVIESFQNIYYLYDNIHSKSRNASCINYLKANEVYNYFWAYDQNKPNLNHSHLSWTRTAPIFYDKDRGTPGLTKTLKSLGGMYDTATHEYLGDYLRFLRDYYNVNLMSLYNCFNNKICTNLYYEHKIKSLDTVFDPKKSETDSLYKEVVRVFDSQDPNYHIYAIPVKLFQDYTIAIDCSHELELFCGFYKTSLDTTSKSVDLINKTYRKLTRTFFKQPFLYDALNVSHWSFEQDIALSDEQPYPRFVDDKCITRWDIANREQDLKLFIKIPTYCKSTITILEGNYLGFNDTIYIPTLFRHKKDGSVFNPTSDDPALEDRSKAITNWEYRQNRAIINFGDNIDLNNTAFTPIGKVQLMAFNTGESYPFADRLVEYLVGSAITTMDETPDNIKRVQKAMSQNKHYFKIEGLWEDKMQKIIYDYLMNSGPIRSTQCIDINGNPIPVVGTLLLDNNQKVQYEPGRTGRVKVTKNGADIDYVDVKTIIEDKRSGLHPKLGYNSKSTLYDILGYIDKDAEKWYAGWKLDKDKVAVANPIQNIDIYNGLFDI